MISLETTENGVILAVRAMPGSRKNEIRGEQDGALKVSVTQIPEKGKANKAVQTQLAKSLGLRVSQIQLLTGETGRLKKFLITGITENEMRKIVEKVI